MVFFCALLFGFGLSPFTEKDRETGRLVGVVFRGHHESPLRSRAGEGEKRNPMQRGVKTGKDLKITSKGLLPTDYAKRAQLARFMATA
jgi:hypothetical protein